MYVKLVLHQLYSFMSFETPLVFLFSLDHIVSLNFDAFTCTTLKPLTKLNKIYNLKDHFIIIFRINPYITLKNVNI